MMTSIRFLRRLLTRLALALTTVTLVACGGGGSGGSATSAQGGAEPSGRVIQGGISAFGSIVVNGVHYDITSATITADGRSITEDDLGVGMVVRVTGSVNPDGTTGTATLVSYDDDLQGPVTAVDAAAGSIGVLGQTVLVDADTVFEGYDLAGLALGNVIEVSGYFDGNGALRASRVEFKAGTLGVGDELEVKGTVSALDSGARTFELGGMTIDYSAALLSDLPGGALADGQFVEVKSVQAPAGGVLVASEVEAESRGIGGEDGEEAELEGYVTAVTDSTRFSVGGQPVTVSGDTAYVNGPAAGLVLNARVKVRGSFDAGGAIAADTVEFRRSSNIEVEGDVDAVDATAATVTVLGVDFAITDATMLDDHSNARLRPFSLSDVASGDRLEVKAYSSGEALVATSLRREDADTEYKVKGPASAVADPGFEVLGLSVTTDGSTTFYDAAEAPISRAAFFGALADGDYVEAEGGLLGARLILADDAELED